MQISHVTNALDSVQAEQIIITGQVQGVGFRPFVYRLAHRFQLTGSVHNEAGQVVIHAQGSKENIQLFKHALLAEIPAIAKPKIHSAEVASVKALSEFSILASESNHKADIHTPPDYFTCPDCLREMRDPNNRRYAYPFINCTQCGPRYTLIKALPYDRKNTTMAEFTLCPQCRQEYQNPLDRRFHAEPIACPNCGPQLQFYSPKIGLIGDTPLALKQCISSLREGAIVAVKGIGGYHLMCDAHNDESVRRLRQQKPRPHKPLAVMFPQTGVDPLAAIRIVADVTPQAEQLLLSPARPIVLIKLKQSAAISAYIAPNLNEIGVMLPYSPLHTLLLDAFQGPLVATSANISGEPVMTNNLQVEQRLQHVADVFLHHNRPIERPADDTVYRVIAEAPRPMRLGRGTCPLELQLPIHLEQPLLAAGGHMKNSIALAWSNRVVISPHIGDLGTPRSLEVFTQVVGDLQKLYQVHAKLIVCDAHPGYASSRWAKQQGLAVHEVFHHHAHASAVAGEFAQEEQWLVFAWDGVGLGEDGSLWGGETFYGKPGQWQRVASQRLFYLPGGEKAGREPWRSALALCWETDQSVNKPLFPKNTEVLYKAWQRRMNSPQTSAVGRLFDAAAALSGVCTHTSFEGQAPMQLEATAAHSNAREYIALPLQQDHHGLWRSDWSPLVPMLLDENQPVADRAVCFHYSMAESIVQQCELFRGQYGDLAVGLSGGVFQNRLLTERVMQRLAEEQFRVYLPQLLPCNDGGLCFGQIIEAAHGTWNS
jgi:hydrogenase maturation protein HypF